MIFNETYYVRFKNREPDPGKCQVIAINWENRQLEVINGVIRLYPSFDEVDIVDERFENFKERFDAVVESMSREEILQSFRDCGANV